MTSLRDVRRIKMCAKNWLIAYYLTLNTNKCLGYFQKLMLFRGVTSSYRECPIFINLWQ